MKPTFAFAATLALASCAGYQLGGLKPGQLDAVGKISVPMFVNDTAHPRAEALATSAVTDAFVQDGTYRLARRAEADAVLEGTLAEIDYSSLRGSRRDTLLPEELTNRVTLRWVLRDARDPTRVLATGTSTGESQLFVDSNLQTARNNALPDALERAGEALVSKLATGF